MRVKFNFLSFSLHVTADNLRKQTKYEVFLSQLLLLFQFCHICKADNPKIEASQEGTMAVVTTTCQSAKCSKQVFTWKSRPYMPGTQIAAGNFLLCFAFFGRGSASKVNQIFQHMGLGCVNLRTFFRYQSVSTLHCTVVCISKPGQPVSVPQPFFAVKSFRHIGKIKQVIR